MGETGDSNIIRPTVAYEYLAIVCVYLAGQPTLTENNIRIIIKNTDS